jgi:hypothetical protein
VQPPARFDLIPDWSPQRRPSDAGERGLRGHRGAPAHRTPRASGPATVDEQLAQHPRTESSLGRLLVIVENYRSSEQQTVKD